MDDLAFRSATELVGLLRDRQVSSRELLDVYLDRVERLNPAVNAVVTLDAERARAEAAGADEARARARELGPLHGLPITVKDAFETEGLRTTCGMTALADHVPARDAVAVARLRAAGAVVFGKTNTPAMAGDAQTYNDVFGTTNNPWDPARTAGGSSGGSAAAVAAGLTGMDLGSDLSGSLRMPASFCGVFTLKPTYGVVPAAGHIPPPPGTLTEVDVGVVGPLARSADDLDLWLSVVAGPDEGRAVAWRYEAPPPRASSLADYRVAAWLDDPACAVGAEVAELVEAAAAALRDAGAKVDERAGPVPLAEGLDVSQRLVQGAIAHALGQDDFDELVRRAEGAAPGDDSPPVRWARNITQRVRDHNVVKEHRARLAAAWAEFFRDYDVLLSPVTPTPAFPHTLDPDVDARTITVDGSPRPYGEQFAWVQAVGVVHLPAVVAPVGLTAGGLPVGVQVVAPYLEDRTAIDVARRLAATLGGFRPPPGW